MFLNSLPVRTQLDSETFVNERQGGILSKLNMTTAG